MRRACFTLFATVLVTAGCATTSMQTVRVGETVVEVEVADTVPEQILGLGQRDGLGWNQGMLFPFSEPQAADFWMRGMRFGLDFIWIRDRRVVGITPNVPAPTSTTLIHYHSPEPVDAVLEVNAGWVEAHQIEVGDPVTFDTP